jgi:hypothetical protein
MGLKLMEKPMNSNLKRYGSAAILAILRRRQGQIDRAGNSGGGQIHAFEA